MPFSSSSLFREDKDWSPADLFMPGSKGMTPSKAIDLFKRGIKPNEEIDEAYIREVYFMAARNNLDPYSLFKAALTSVKAEHTGEFSKDLKTAEDFKEKAKDIKSLAEKKKYNKRLDKVIKDNMEKKKWLQNLDKAMGELKRFEIEYKQLPVADYIINNIAIEMSKDLDGLNPLFLVILNGSFIFAADLVRKLTFECETSFVKLASYEGTYSTTDVKQLIGLNQDIEGRHIVILEDIIDTGITMTSLLEQMEWRKPASVSIATLLFKPNAFIKEFRIDYIGLEIPNDFIVGFGLDYDGQGRNLPDIYKIIE